MPTCPICMIELRTVRQREGIYFSCAQCGGRAVTLPQLRRVAGDRFVNRLIHQINSAMEIAPSACPFCRGRMKRFQITEPDLTLDACRPCGAVWFDPGEFEEVPEGAVESPEALLLRSQETLATHKVEQIAEQARRTNTTSGDPPDEEWKWVPAFFGLPVCMENDGLGRLPWFIWLLSATIAAVSISAFFNLEPAIQHFGLIPAQPWRLDGLTLLTSFFLHAGPWHLVSNLYFLVLFGMKVEDYLGRWRCALVILLAALTGDGLHVLLDPRSSIPSIGASGGIAGIITFYALEFPRARLGFLMYFYWRFNWIQFPAWGALVVWLIIQFWGGYEQISGFGEVSALAHLGGAAIGVTFWLIWRKATLRPILE